MASSPGLGKGLDGLSVGTAQGPRPRARYEHGVEDDAEDHELAVAMANAS